MGGDRTRNAPHRLIGMPGQNHARSLLEQPRQGHLQKWKGVGARRVIHQSARQGAGAPFVCLEGQASGQSRTLHRIGNLSLAWSRQVIHDTTALQLQQRWIVLELGVAVTAQGQQQPNLARVS